MVRKSPESILRDKIYMHIDVQGLFRDSQHGFVREIVSHESDCFLKK